MSLFGWRTPRRKNAFELRSRRSEDLRTVGGHLPLRLATTLPNPSPTLGRALASTRPNETERPLLNQPSGLPLCRTFGHTLAT